VSEPTPAAAPPPAHSGEPAKFVTGSTMRHVVVMTATGSIGLVAVFIVDALNLFYISLSGSAGTRSGDRLCRHASVFSDLDRHRACRLPQRR
jgi:hypothetical protein